MNMHSADATTAEEALAIQETIDSDMATEIAMQDTLLTRVFTPLILTNWMQLMSRTFVTNGIH